MAQITDLPAACWIAILQRVAARDVLALACTCKELAAAANDELLWRELAKSKWGEKVPAACPTQPPAAAGGKGSAAAAGATAAPTTWRGYCLHRMSFRHIRRSPLSLLQEAYPDPWQHVIACVLCTRTSAKELITATVAAFFRAYPSPSAVLEADEGPISELMRPLGLQPVRCKAVKDVSHNFLNTHWTAPSAFYGCGKFVDDSWRIFCMGDFTGKGVEDINLKRYLSWARCGEVEDPADHASSAAAKRKQQEEAEGRKAKRLREQARQLVEAACKRVTRSAVTKACSNVGDDGGCKEVAKGKGRRGAGGVGGKGKGAGGRAGSRCALEAGSSEGGRGTKSSSKGEGKGEGKQVGEEEAEEIVGKRGGEGAGKAVQPQQQGLKEAPTGRGGPKRPRRGQEEDREEEGGPGGAGAVAMRRSSRSRAANSKAPPAPAPAPGR